MGLIMLILIGTVPTAYALNRAVPAHYEVQFHDGSVAAQKALAAHSGGVPAPVDSRRAITAYLADKTATPQTVPALATLVGDIDHQVATYGAIAHVPASATKNMRNELNRLVNTVPDPKARKVSVSTQPIQGT